MDGDKITLAVSQDEAQSQAEALLNDLEINDINMAAVKIGFAYFGEEGSSVLGAPQCYPFSFTRRVKSVPSTYDDRTGDATNSDAYDRTWAYERVVVGVDDEGIVQFFWEGNAKVMQTATSNVKLMSFDELMDIFKTNMGTRYTYTEDSAVMDSTYQITKITLGFTRIKTEDGYHLAPVWDFFGTVQTTTAEGDTQNTALGWLRWKPEYHELPDHQRHRRQCHRQECRLLRGGKTICSLDGLYNASLMQWSPVLPHQKSTKKGKTLRYFV